MDANEDVPAGTGRFAPVHVPPDNESTRPRTMPPIWYVPTATHEPAAGHANDRNCDPDAGAGSGAAVALQDPPDNVSTRACPPPVLGVERPTAVHDAREGQLTEVNCA
jgi:hypothetical protein